MKVTTANKLNGIPLIFMFSVVTLFSIVFVILSFFILNEKVPENYVEVQATIVEIVETGTMDNYEYHVYIDYTFGDKTYTHKPYNKYNSSMKKGKTVTIYVNPDSTEEYMSDTSDNYLFLVISGVFLIIGVAGVVINVKRLINDKRRSD